MFDVNNKEVRMVMTPDGEGQVESFAYKDGVLVQVQVYRTVLDRRKKQKEIAKWYNVNDVDEVEG